MANQTINNVLLWPPTSARALLPASVYNDKHSSVTISNTTIITTCDTLESYRQHTASGSLFNGSMAFTHNGQHEMPVLQQLPGRGPGFLIQAFYHTILPGTPFEGDSFESQTATVALKDVTYTCDLESGRTMDNVVAVAVAR